MAYNLNTKIWQTGALEWWGMIENQDMYLGSREFPQPPDEGDEWKVTATGDRFKIINSEICRIAVGEEQPW